MGIVGPPRLGQSSGTLLVVCLTAACCDTDLDSFGLYVQWEDEGDVVMYRTEETNASTRLGICGAVVVTARVIPYVKESHNATQLPAHFCGSTVL